jgi:hypothetical protein
MKLLIEKTTDFESVIEIIEEGVSADKGYFIRGPFLQGEIKNHNKRIYPKEILFKEVSRYSAAKIDDNQAVGELGHPDSPTINLDRVSHKILSLTEDKNNYIGKAKILDTPFGKIVKNLMDEKVKFGVSSRGLGSLKDEDGAHIVCEDFYLITPADIVSDPSGPDCFVTALTENKEWVWESGKLFEKEKEIKKMVDTVVRRQGINELALLSIFENILKEI